MVKKCERPSCRERGEVAYVIDTANLLVSIDAPISKDLSRVNILCRRHADSLVVPRDWQIIDNRTKKQRLFSAPATRDLRETQIPRRKTKIGEKKSASSVVQDLFEFATRVVAAPPPVPTKVEARDTESEAFEESFEAALEHESIDPQETQAMPWTPQFDRTGDLDGQLRAQGKLLSRAFGSFDDSDVDHDQQHPEY